VLIDAMMIPNRFAKEPMPLYILMALHLPIASLILNALILQSTQGIMAQWRETNLSEQTPPLGVGEKRQMLQFQIMTTAG